MIIDPIMAEMFRTAGIPEEQWEAHAQALKAKTVPERGVSRSEELVRILNLPRRLWDADAEALAERMTHYLRAPGGTQRLRPVQAAALRDAHDQGGMFGMIRVGGGKTLISLLVCTILGLTKPLLLIPAKLKDKTIRDMHALRKHWLIPAYVYIVSYELLGREQSAKLLELWGPDGIICDEVHKLKGTKSVCTKRVGRHLEANPHVKFVGMSGTVTKRSIKDYAHIAGWCLKHKSPTPRDYNTRMEWSLAIDDQKNEDNQLAIGALIEFCSPEERAVISANQEDPIRTVRKAYRRRLTETPGVVATQEGALGMSLRIDPLIIKDLAITGWAHHMRTTWKRPDDVDMMDGIEVWRHLREIACGFYYRWWNHEGFTTCLTKILNESGRIARPIVRQILIACASTTAIDTEMARALERLRSSLHTFAYTSSESSTTSQTKNSPHSNVSSTGPATYASPALGGRSLESAISALITTTQPGRFVVSYAHPATERLACWEIVLRECYELLPIFEEAILASRPPQEWLSARKAWTGVVRKILQNNQRHLDSEKMVKRAMDEGHYPEYAPVLAAWRAIEKAFDPEKSKEAVWLSDASIDASIQWAKDEGGIVWTEHVAYGERLSAKSGLDYYWRQGKNQRGRAIEDHPPGAPMIASIASNSEGRNLQAWSANLITSMPTAGSASEQLIGRTHRDGQESDEVVFWISAAIPEQLAAFDRACADARYISDTTGQEQKLCYADITIPPLEERAGLWT